MTSTATQGFSRITVSRKPTIHDPVFPVHPFAGVLAVAQEEDWRDARLFPSFNQADPLQPPFCSYAEARESIQQALRRHRGLDLAVQSGARKSLPHLGVMGLGLMSHATLGDALRFGLHYQMVAGSMLQLQLDVDRQEAWLAANSLFDDPETHPFLAIDHLATALNSIRQLSFSLQTGGRILKRLELDFEAPSLRSSLIALFDAPVVFGQPVSRMVFDSSALERRLGHYNKATVEFSRQACERELAGRGLDGPPATGGLLPQLYDLQGRLLPLPAVAEAMGTSLRSLHRALASEGIRYTELREQQSRERAEHMLASGLSTAAVAEALRFSDQRSFVRAFERWTGLTPAVWRSHQGR